MTDAVPNLPEPSPGRWRPLRCGLVELFHYDSQEFRFRDGRLLLRGNNGTGKSKVLALTLPFLLDGSLAPHRLEPDGDRGKRMEWNLLLGGEYEDRTGYSWLEFGRRDEDGVDHFLTIGAGMRAIAGRPEVRRWFFSTEARMGQDLSLVDATSTVLGRDRLGQALEGFGAVYETAASYRRAVDEKLFGFGEERYGALVDLLIQLRQPQLSKRPDEDALSHSLSEALAPLDPTIVSDVATAFQNLQEDQDELERLTSVRDAVGHFADEYADYARLAVLRATAGPRMAQSEYERDNRELSSARVRLEEAREERVRRDAEVETVDSALLTFDSRIEALQEAALASGSDRLEAAADALKVAAQTAARAHEESETAQAQHASSTGRRERQVIALEKATQALRTRLSDLLDAANRGGIANEVNGLLGENAVTLHDLERITAAIDGIRVEAERRTGQVAEIRRLSDAVTSARGRRRERQGFVTNAEDQAVTAEDDVTSATDTVTTAGAELLDSTRAQLFAATELLETSSQPLAELIAALESWVDTRAGDNPTLNWVASVHREHADRLDRAGLRLESESQEIERLLDGLQNTIERLESGQVSEPIAPYTRSSDARDARAGAEFWRVVDFAPTLDAAARIGIEAALEASGLLDAWVTVDGRAIATNGDTLLLPRELREGSDTLADLLIPEPSTSIAPAAIHSLLRSIAVDDAPATSEAPAAISSTGAYRIGPLVGDFTKDAAQYIGATARENDRRRRLEEAAVARTLAEADRERLRSERGAVAARRSRLDVERDALPSDRTLGAADANLDAAERYARQRSMELDTTRLALSAAMDDEAGAARSLAETAVELAVPAEDDGIRAVEAALSDLDSERKLLGLSVDSVRTAREKSQEVEGDLLRDRATAELRVRQLSDAAAARDEADVRHRTLDASVGVEVRQLSTQRSEAISQREATRTELKTAQHSATTAAADQGTAEQRVLDLDQRVAERTTVRANQTSEFGTFARVGLIAITVPEIELPNLGSEWAPDPTVRLARRVFEALGGADVPPEEWTRAQTRVGSTFDTLASALSPFSYRAERSMANDVVVVAVRHGSEEQTPHELATILTNQVDDRRRLLSAREREILQNHLVDEVAGTLQELIEAAERQTRNINDELAKRPTSTGVRLRIRWEPRSDGPTGYGEARVRILRQAADVWSNADREAIADFLHERIDTVRAENPAGTWMEHLTLALDYRSWNRFRIDIEQAGKWRPASGPASGGERVLAASVPLFAAASAHYRSAGNPLAPRIITLDEAFAGVDDSARAGYLGLLATFDLDVVMTSEREWACYPEVPGIGIAQLIRTEGVDGVLVERWEWDGATKVLIADATLPQPLGDEHL
jgi:uncharacterized protein (TIGR02680 family)